MVAISFVLVLALVSSTVVAQPGTNGCTGLFARFKQWLTPASTESVYEWIPLDEETSTPTSDEDPVDIGLSYILQQLNIQPDEFTKRTNFTDSFGVTHLYGMPLHQGLFIEDLHAAAHIKNGQVFFYSATTVINDDHALTKRSPTISKSTIKISSKKAVKAAVDHFKIPLYRDIAPVKGSYSTDDGDIPVWIFHLRDNPTTQWIEVKSMQSLDVKRDFTYTAIELPNKSPNDGFSTIVNPENLQASPNGWTDGFELKGNNVLVNYKKRTTFKTTTRGVFNGGFDPTLPPQIPGNLVAGAINAFYVHELTHGLTDRLTGGARTKFCISKIESEGLDEGYSDMMALIFTAKPEDTRNTKKVIGEYAEGSSQGTEGNIIFLQLFVGTLMIQPCEPTFESAYDAMLAADYAYYGGIHEHLIRKGFFKRGLGSISQLDPTMDDAV
ncbi:hypothetical protein BASA83_002954 [Batrachochytrium salamandrivorans]|nr:hypothetical protein BASA83_002954 [Batrachochytrium salamandrivorans]